MREEVLKIRNVETVRVPTAEYMSPHYFLETYSHERPETEKKEVQDELQAAMVYLSRLLGTPATHGREPEVLSKERYMYRQQGSNYDRTWGSNTHGMGPATRYLVETEVVDAMTRLDTAIQEALEQAFWCGKKDGQNIILGLASGEVSVEEFNERSIGRKKREYDSD